MVLKFRAWRVCSGGGRSGSGGAGGDRQLGGSESEEIRLPPSRWVFAVPPAALRCRRISATQLALFHNGAILSSLGCHLPASAHQEHSEGVCACVRVCARLCMSVEALGITSFLHSEQFFQTMSWQPASPPAPPRALPTSVCITSKTRKPSPIYLYSSIFFCLFIFSSLQPRLNVTEACVVQYSNL